MVVDTWAALVEDEVLKTQFGNLYNIKTLTFNCYEMPKTLIKGLHFASQMLILVLVLYFLLEKPSKL